MIARGLPRNVAFEIERLREKQTQTGHSLYMYVGVVVRSCASLHDQVPRPRATLLLDKCRCVCARVRVRVRACVRACVRAYVHTCMPAYIQTYTQTYIERFY